MNIPSCTTRAPRLSSTTLPESRRHTQQTQRSTGASSIDTMESLSPSTASQNNPVRSILKAPKKSSKLLGIGLAVLGFVAGFVVASLRKLDFVSRLAIGFGSGFIFYSLSFLPKIIDRLKNSKERFWARIDLSAWSFNFAQKVVSLLAYIPKIASHGSRLMAVSISSSVFSFIGFALSSVSAARTLLSYKELDQLRTLTPITSETLSAFIERKHNLKWMLEQYLGSNSPRLNKLIQDDPQQAALWIKEVSKGALVFSALSTASQSLGAVAAITGLVSGGIAGVPVFAASTGVFLLSSLAQNIATRIWVDQLPKIKP